MWMRRVVVALLVQGAVGLSVGTAAAQSAYPDRPVQFIVSSAPGGSIDILSRLIAPKLGALLGQPVITINRDGAGGIIGGMSVAKSAADGYTFLMTTSGLIVAHPSLYADNRLDMRTELTPISIVAAFPNVLIVHPSTGLDNVRDLIARARAEPGRIKYASGGNGTSNHLAAELLKYETGIDLLHVPYRGGGPAVQAVVSGVADMVFVAPSPAIPLINAGLVKALAVTSREPSRLVPGMPTMIEAGVPNFQLTNWIGVLAPKAIPPEISNRVSKAIAETVRSPDVAELLIKNGYEGVGDTAVEMAKVIDTETAMWARVIKAAGISVN